jgi:mRNA interferase RelE/StbE
MYGLYGSLAAKSSVNCRQTKSNGGNNLKIVYSKDSLKFLAKADKSDVSRIRSAIDGLTLIPAVGDIKVMQGYKDGRMRLRVGKYRIIYRYDSNGEIEVLLIIDIGSRGDIYK